MQIPQYKSNRKYGFNMTPMIDVVFLLIIFFLVSSHLSRQESQLELELPTASTGQDDVDQETPRLTINVQADGSMLLALSRPSKIDWLVPAWMPIVLPARSASVRIGLPSSSERMQNGFFWKVAPMILSGAPCSAISRPVASEEFLGMLGAGRPQNAPTS